MFDQSGHEILGLRFDKNLINLIESLLALGLPSVFVKIIVYV